MHLFFAHTTRFDFRFDFSQRRRTHITTHDDINGMGRFD